MKFAYGSVNLVLTSPPFALRRKKSYGNVSADEYIHWFWPFAKEIYRVLNRPSGLNNPNTCFPRPNPPYSTLIELAALMLSLFPHPVGNNIPVLQNQPEQLSS